MKHLILPFLTGFLSLHLTACARFEAISADVNKKAGSPSQKACDLLPPKCGNTATLSWIAPTTNADGSPVTGLAGFKIYVGNDSKTYTRVIDVPVATQTSYQFANLVSGSYYVALTAYNSAGESEKSVEAMVCMKNTCTKVQADLAQAAAQAMKATADGKAVLSIE